MGLWDMGQRVAGQMGRKSTDRGVGQCVVSEWVKHRSVGRESLGQLSMGHRSMSQRVMTDWISGS